MIFLDCYAGLCKCKIGYGPSIDRKVCRKSKKIGQTCDSADTCYMDKLQCDDQTKLCKCAPGYKYDSIKNDCVWVYFCDDNLIYDTIRRQCIKQTDFWFPTANHNPKLSFITFVLLVFCFIKVMRSNSPYNERRRRISGNMNRNSFDLLSTIINYENNQRYPIRSETNNRRSNIRSHLRRNDEDPEIYFDENQPPPPYEEIMIRSDDDLKAVTVLGGQTNQINNQLNNRNTVDIELKELNRDVINRDELNEENDRNKLNQTDPLTNNEHIESTAGSNDSRETNHSQIVNNNNSINNRNLINNEISNHSLPSTNQLEEGQSTVINSMHSSNQNSTSINTNRTAAQLTNNQPTNQSNLVNQSNEQLPTYEQAIMISKNSSDNFT